VSLGRVLLLNTPPSCGKTSLACALRDILDEPWLHLSLDDLSRGCKSEFWLTDDGSLFERVLVAYLGALRSLALAGNDVSSEAVMTPSNRLPRV
jgi:chloramphenicol 3-O-phosphotransferase